MKKSFLFTFIVLFAFIGMVSAKDCTIVSGTGKNIGDEIACGEEHFYIINKGKDETKMLAKYNLYTGISIYKEKLAENQTCEDLASSMGGEVKNDDFYNAPGYCFYTKKIETDKVLQRKEAQSAHQDNEGNYIYPQIGDVYPFWGGAGHMVDSYFVYDLGFNIDTSNDYQLIGDEKYNGLFADANINVSPLKSQTSINYGEVYNELGGALYSYYNELINSGFSIKNIDLLSLDDLNEIVKHNGKTIPYEEWNDNVENMTMQYFSQYERFQYGVLKDYLKTEWKWLYDRTYWLKTLSGATHRYNRITLLFVDNYGDVCGAPGFGSSVDYGCVQLVKTAIGAGIRPVITINTSDILESNKELTSEEKKEESKQEKNQEPKQVKNPDTETIPSYILFLLLITISLIFINKKYKSIYKIK